MGAADRADRTRITAKADSTGRDPRSTQRRPFAPLSCALAFLALLTPLLSGCGSIYDTSVGKFFGEVFEIEDPRVKEARIQAEKDAQIAALVEELRNDESVRAPQAVLRGDGTDTVTVLFYLNGSNLETEAGEATEDLTEILDAGGSENVHFLVQTMGTKYWHKKYGIASDHTQIYEAGTDGLSLVRDDLGQLACTDEETLRDFILWGAENYPADRYILILWDHGGGPVYGFGYDQFQDYDAALTLDEIRSAVADSGIYFDFIGMDCCIMSCLEVACALYDFCDFTILSEDFESGLGWYYTDWLAALYENSSVSTPELAQLVIDGTVRANEQDEYPEESILALIDEAYIPALYNAWMAFAYANEAELLARNFSQYVSGTGRVHPMLQTGGPTGFPVHSRTEESEDYDLSEYYITDLMAVTQILDVDETPALRAALDASIAYVGKTEGNAFLTGLSVTLPYGDPDFYGELKPVFTRSGLDGEYVSWLEKFTTASGSNDYYDFGVWRQTWEGAAEWFGKLDWYYWEGE